MRKSLIGGLLIIGLLAGCGSIRDSRLNPLNWFGKSQVEATDGVRVVKSLSPRKGYIDFKDTRPLVAQVIGLSIDRTTDGAIIRATGANPATGYYDADLVLVDSSRSGRLTYQFRIRPPKSVTATGTAAQRQTVAVIHLSAAELAGVREIEVQGANGSRVSRR